CDPGDVMERRAHRRSLLFFSLLSRLALLARISLTSGRTLAIVFLQRWKYNVRNSLATMPGTLVASSTCRGATFAPTGMSPERNRLLTTKTSIAAAVTLVVAGALVAWSDGGTGGGGGDNSNATCTNKLVNTDAPVVTMWAWYPNMEEVVDNFNKAHDDVQVCWNNAGAGGEEYDKFQTAVSAGSGAPDVVMLEGDRIPTYVAQGALVDLRDLGYEDVKDNFSEG